MSKKEQMKSREKNIKDFFINNSCVILPGEINTYFVRKCKLGKKDLFPPFGSIREYLANILNVNIWVNSMSFAIQNIIKHFILYHIFKPSKIERAFENKNLRAA